MFSGANEITQNRVLENPSPIANRETYEDGNVDMGLGLAWAMEPPALSCKNVGHCAA